MRACKLCKDSNHSVNNPPQKKYPRVKFHWALSDNDKDLNEDFAAYPDWGLNVPDYIATVVNDFPYEGSGTRYMEIREEVFNFVDVADMAKMKEAMLGLSGRSVYVTFMHEDPKGTGKSFMVTEVFYGCDIACYDATLPPYDFCKQKDPKLYGIVAGQANICNSWHPCQWASSAQVK